VKLARLLFVGEEVEVSESALGRLLSELFLGRGEALEPVAVGELPLYDELRKARVLRFLFF
jgi:hypothetical protein